MTDYTRAEVLDAFRPLLDEIGWAGLKYEDYSDDELNLELRGETVPFTVHETYGGSDLGTEAWMIFKVGDQLFRKDGYYSSYGGYDWDGTFQEVIATPKTITVYEPKR